MASRTLLVALILVIIVVAGVAGYLATRPAPTPTATTTTAATTSPPTTTTTTIASTTTTMSTTSPTATTTSPPPTTTAPTTTATTTTTTTSPTATTTTPAEAITLVVLTRHPGDILKEAEDAFLKSDIAKKYNIVAIKWLQLPPGWWVTYIKERKDVDVAWGGGPTLFDVLYNQGLLAPLTTSEVLRAVNQIPDTIAGAPMKRIDDKGKIYWVAAAIASFGFTVNHDKLAIYGLPVPKSWSDLGSPTFGKPLIEYGAPAVGIADPTQSTSNTRMYEIILQRYGWDEGWKLLTAMAANAQVYSGSGDVRDAVIRGDIAVGITIDFYGYTAHLQNPSCEYIIPSGETIVNGDPIALVATSKHPEAAQAFIAWVLTEGQKIWLDPDINRLPANPNVFNTPEGAKRADLKEAFEVALKTTQISFNDTLALMYESAMRYYFKAVLVDLNSELKQVWKALLTKYSNKEITEDQFKMYLSEIGSPLMYVDPLTGEKVTFTLEDAIRVTSEIARDPKIIDHYMLAWKKAASERYQKVLSELSS
ncbi:MAG: ABC transporter substrate-binding protein [Desulfurococcales archaeon]|nr:ABC transporter substrate-binding protein [Desulfurococcales archaeon]